MINKTLLFLLLIIFQSCIDEADLRPIVPNHLLHANSCKVWILEGVYQEGKNITSPLAEEKRAFLFYYDNSLYIQKRISLGSKKGEKAYFNMSINKEKPKDTLMNFYFDANEKIQFKVNYIDAKKLMLTRISNNEVWQFIVLPKPFL